MTGLYGDLVPIRQNKDYLKREQKESIRDFINNGREILITQITINDKIEETTHLKEYIESEEEQLREGRRLFEEDKQKFNKYLEHQENKTNEAVEISKQLTEQKQNLMDEINGINKEIQETDIEIRKVEDSLENYISNICAFNMQNAKSLLINSPNSNRIKRRQMQLIASTSTSLQRRHMQKTKGKISSSLRKQRIRLSQDPTSMPQKGFLTGKALGSTRGS